MATAHAATRVDLHAQDVAQLNQQYQTAALSLGAPSDPKLKHAEMLGLDADSSLQVLTTAKDRNGTTHYRYQQTYRGRSEERRVGKESVSTCRYRWSPYH